VDGRGALGRRAAEWGVEKVGMVLCPNGVREDREQGLRDHDQEVSRQVTTAGSVLVHPKNLSGVPSLSAPKRQRREREPCVKSQKCPANSIAIQDK